MNNNIRELLKELKDYIQDAGWTSEEVDVALNGIEGFSMWDLRERYFVYEDGDHLLTEARYGNSGGFAFAVVASLLFRQSGERRGELLYWAAYWGGCDLTQHKEDAVRWVAANRNKLSRDDAQHYFPQFPIAYYRE